MVPLGSLDIMTPTTVGIQHSSTRPLLVRRVRVVLAVCILGAMVFGALDLASWGPEIVVSFMGKLIGISLALIAMVLVGQRWVVPRTWVIAVFVVSVCYIVTAADRILLPDREYHTTALLFVGAAMTTSVIIPWGVLGQLITVAVGAVCMLVAIYARDGSLAAVASDPSAAVVIAFLLSLGAAREVERYRLGHRRELLERRRAEAKLRRFAQQLEQLVAERTRAPQQAHEALRQHQGELAHVLRLHTMGEMAAAMAHEINQPLCAITNYAQGGVQRLRSGFSDPTVLRLAFEAIAREGLRAGQILRGIRNLVQRETAVSDGADVNAPAPEAPARP